MERMDDENRESRIGGWLGLRVLFFGRWQNCSIASTGPFWPKSQAGMLEV